MQKKTYLTTTAALACAVLVNGCMSQPLSSGNPLPAVRVAGWTNGTAPNWEELAGQVVVLEVFATW